LDSIQVDLQTRNGNVFSGRDCKQLAKCFYRLFELTDAIRDLAHSGKKVKPSSPPANGQMKLNRTK